MRVAANGSLNYPTPKIGGSRRTSNSINKGVFDNILSDLDDACQTLKVLHAAYSSAASKAQIVSTSGPFKNILGFKTETIIFE